MSLVLYTELGAIAGEFLAAEVLAGAEGDQYTMPASLVLEDDDAAMRFRAADRALQHGSAVDGEEWDSREIVVSGALKEATAADLAALLRTLKQKAGRTDQRLLVDSDRYVNVARLRKFDVRFEPEWGRSLASVRISWLAADPFWYSASVSGLEVELEGDDSFEVDAGELATVAMHPVITITAPAGESLSATDLDNATDGRGFNYDDPGLEDGAAAVIDTDAGTATRGGSSTIRYFSGAWPRLLPGINSWTWEGGAATLSFTWTERWI